MFDIKDKNAFITGGASGIGLAVAVRFVKAGAKVIIADISDAADAAHEIGAEFVHVDAGNEESVAAALEQAVTILAGKLDIVCNNAGVGDIGFTFEETDQALVEKVTRINQWGVLYGLKHAPKYMNDNGSIINSSSLAAMLALPGSGVYSASKAAVVNMTQMSALELGKRGIRVNAVCPSYIETPMTGADENDDKVCKLFSALGRKGITDDLAGVFHFLAANESSYISGHALPVDGGWLAGLTQPMLKALTGSELSPE